MMRVVAVRSHHVNNVAVRGLIAATDKYDSEIH